MLSGADCTLLYSGNAFSFSRADLARRAIVAAEELGLVGSRQRGEAAARRDLLRLVTTGEMANPESEAARELLRRTEQLVNGGVGEVVYWLRKLIFRSAWVDARVTDGRVRATFDERTGAFGYEADGFALAPTRRDDLPSWSSPSRRERASR